MTPEHWQRIDHLLQEVVALPHVQRSAFLDQACVGDEASRSEVESLLSFRERAENFLEVPALDSVAGLLFEDQPQSWVGRSVGPYVIEGQLGSGGMGEVYLAHDSRLERKVAIKFLPPGLAADEQARRRLITEARAAARLDHPNICAIHEVEEDSGHTFIVMQYVEGETLASKIRRQPLHPNEALDVVIHVAEALDQAHSRGIIHRDIKPQNIMITSQGQVKVLDFGLAKLMGSEEVSSGKEQPQSLWSAQGLIVGTAPYMSPEQATGAPVDARSDIFSLGTVLYECVTGTAPFSGRTAMDVCGQVIHLDPPPPSQIAPSVTAELDRVTLKALAKDQDARYQSAADLLKDLHAMRSLLRGEDRGPAKTVLLDLRSRLAASIRHRPRIFASASAMGLVLLSLLAVSLWPGEIQYRPSSNADQWYREGIAALRDGVYHQASTRLGRAIQIDDRFALARAHLAEAYAELDYSDKARDEWARVTQLVPNPSRLPRRDALLLRAIQLGLTREFQQAIDVYRQLADQSPESERPGAYFDLGRAYERNDQIDEAIRQYQKVTELDPEVAGAFLRAGTLYGQQQQTGRALEALQKAEDIYKAQGNHEGLTEVRYQRGFIYSSLGKFNEALGQLRQALDTARIVDNRHQQIRALLQLSRLYCTSGNTAEAEKLAIEALSLAQGTENLATQGLIELGEAYRVRGDNSADFAEAEKHFNKALEIARANGGRRNEARALLSLAKLSDQRHDPDGALRYIEQALPFFQQRGYRKEASEALSLLGDAKELKGEYEAALQAYRAQLEDAGQGENTLQTAALHVRIGFVFAHQERFSDALRHFDDSYSIYQSLPGDTLHTGYALANRGDMLWRLGDYEQARHALTQASLLSEQLDTKNRHLSARIELVSAQMALSERRLPEAISRSQQALILYAGTAHAVEAKYTLGLAQSLSGAERAGVRTCEQAVDMAKNTNDPRMQATALLALAEALFESGDATRASATALEAQQSFLAAGQQESEWRAWLVAARANHRLGNNSGALNYALRADAVLSGLRDSWGEEAYNHYLTRPDVQDHSRQLSQLLAIK